MPGATLTESRPTLPTLSEYVGVVCSDYLQPAVLFTNDVTRPSVETDTSGWTLNAGNLTDMTTISGLAAWHKPESLGANNAAISSWADSSGNSHPVTQATGSKQPLTKTNILNGYSVARFDGVDDFLKATYTLPEPCEMFIVFSNVGWTAGLAVTDGGGTVNTMLLQQTGSSGQVRQYAGGGADPIQNFGTGAFHIASASWNGASSFLSKDGGTDSVQNVAASTPGGLTVGANQAGGNNSQIDVAEILVFTGTLSNADRRTVEGYLGNKYAISGPTAPAGLASLTRVNTWSAAGTWSARFQSPASTTNAYLDSPSFAVTASGRLSARIAVHAVTISGGNVPITIKWSDGTSTAALATVTAAGDSVVSVANQAVPAGVTTATFHAAPSAVGTYDISFDAVLKVEGASLPPGYFDGSTAPNGYTSGWSGTAHASTSYLFASV